MGVGGFLLEMGEARNGGGGWFSNGQWGEGGF